MWYNSLCTCTQAKEVKVNQQQPGQPQGQAYQPMQPQAVFPPSDSWPSEKPVVIPPSGTTYDTVEKRHDKLFLRAGNLVMAVICGLLWIGVGSSYMTLRAVGQDIPPALPFTAGLLFTSLIANIVAGLWPLRTTAASLWVRIPAIASTPVAMLLQCNIAATGS